MDELYLFLSLLFNFITRFAYEEFLKIARPEPLDGGRYQNIAGIPLWMCNPNAQTIFNMVCFIPLILVLVDMGWGFMHVKWWMVLLLTFGSWLATGVILIIVEKLEFHRTLFVLLSIPFPYISSVLLWVYANNLS